MSELNPQARDRRTNARRKIRALIHYQTSTQTTLYTASSIIKYIIFNKMQLHALTKNVWTEMEIHRISTMHSHNTIADDDHHNSRQLPLPYIGTPQPHSSGTDQQNRHSGANKHYYPNHTNSEKTQTCLQQQYQPHSCIAAAIDHKLQSRQMINRCSLEQTYPNQQSCVRLRVCRSANNKPTVINLSQWANHATSTYRCNIRRPG